MICSVCDEENRGLDHRIFKITYERASSGDAGFNVSKLNWIPAEEYVIVCQDCYNWFDLTWETMAHQVYARWVFIRNVVRELVVEIPGKH